MTPEQLKKLFSNLNTWKRGGERAPHKPLLLLYALGRTNKEKPRLFSFVENKDQLKELLHEFGPPRFTSPNYPFIRLQNDGIWDVSSNKTLDSKKDWSDKVLLENKTFGGFSEEVHSLLLGHKNLAKELAILLLEKNFPESLHRDILNSVGLDLESPILTRDRNFRDRILRAYEYSCAVCGFNVRLRHTLVAVEAAHIKWHQAGGPDIENNGIALCSMHHKLFDRGVFTITSSMEFRVAEMAHGTHGFNEWLMNYHGRRIRNPINPEYEPSEDNIGWHVREVFRGPERYSPQC